VPDTIPPTAPGAPVAGTITPSSIALSWAAATDNYGVSSYQVYRNGTLVGTVTSLTYTDTGLTPSTTYTYTVKALDAAGNASPVSPATPVATAAGNIVTVYYKIPSGWTTVDIHYAPTGGTWTTVPGVPMAAACTGFDSYTINLGAATGAQVVFNNGSGTWDNNSGNNYTVGTGIAAVVNGAVSSGTNPCGVDATAPTTPTGVQATAMDSNTVTVAWTASTDNVGVTGYKVLRGGTQVGTVTTGTSYTDSTVAANTTYSYTVQAYDAAGNVSPVSSPASVTTPIKVDTQAPTVPTNLVSSNVTATTATVSWTASTDNVAVATYLVFRNGSQIGSTAATSWSDSNLTASTTYSYTV
jgi:chitodextrinase